MMDSNGEREKDHVEDGATDRFVANPVAERDLRAPENKRSKAVETCVSCPVPWKRSPPEAGHWFRMLYGRRDILMISGR